MSSLFKTVFGNQFKPVIGMVHVPALPGTPLNKLKPVEILKQSLHDARILVENGVDALLIENMHDVPYLKRKAGPEVVSMMSLIGHAMKQESGLPVGIQILAGANKEALAVAYAADLDFIRAEAFVFAHTADEGIMESDAGELLRYRKQIGAENIAVFTDIRKKHASHALTADLDIREHVSAARFFLSDGVIITGAHTGIQPDVEELRAVQNMDIPILIGSGLTVDNMETFFPLADAFIIGSHFKYEGKWQNPPDPDRVKTFMNKVKTLRSSRD